MSSLEIDGSEPDYSGEWLQTFSGRKFFPFDPRPEDIFIEDIAHALAMLCRFVGHTKKFFSVAQHSVLVSQTCPPEHAKQAILHDAAEAYCSDIARPLKHAEPFALYRVVEAKIQKAIYDRFDLPFPDYIEVKKADLVVLVTEARDLMAPLAPGWQYTVENGYPALPYKIEPVGPEEAEAMFMTEYVKLFGKCPAGW